MIWVPQSAKHEYSSCHRTPAEQLFRTEQYLLLIFEYKLQVIDWIKEQRFVHGCTVSQHVSKMCTEDTSSQKMFCFVSFLTKCCKWIR